MTRRRRPRTAQERVIGVLGTVAPGSLGGRIRNTRPAVVAQPNTGGPPDTGSSFDPNENPVIIGASATAGGGSTPSSLTGAAANTVAIGHTAQATAASAIAVGNTANASATDAVSIGDTSFAQGLQSVSIGFNAGSRHDSDIAIGAHSSAGAGGSGIHYNLAIGYFASIDAGSLTSLTGGIAIGYSTVAGNDMCTAVGSSARASWPHATAIGANSRATAANQVMLGTTADFVEIPGNGTANGLVLTDTADGTRYLVQITSGALVLSTAP